MPKIVDHDQRREEIALSVMKAVAKFGLERVKLEHVAQEAKCTTGLLMHFYPNKKAMLNAAMEIVVTALGERYEAAVNEPDLVEGLSSVLPLDTERKREWKVWLSYWGGAPFKPQDRSRTHAFYNKNHVWIRNLLELAVERGEISAGIDIDAAADHLVGLTDGIGIRATLDPSAWPAEAQIEYIESYVKLLK